MTDWITTPHGLLAWAATYLLHSTLLLGAAWAVSRFLSGRSLRLEERLWKAALVGALLTATVQTGVAGLPAPASPEPAVRAAVAAPAGGMHAGAVALRTASTGDAPKVAPVTSPAPGPRLNRLSALLPGWQRLALAAWALGALLLVTSLATRWARLRLRLRRREDVAGGAPRQLLDRLLESTESRRRVRLTGSSALPVPVALGVAEQEICLPHRALRELDDRRQRGLLAHELAHLERRDPAWLLLALAVESVLFFQPLNRLARRRLEEIAELQCDAWAVRATGDRLGLARCLTEVAGWLLEGRTLSAPAVPGAAAMARSRGRLGLRVRRILSSGAADDELGGGRRWVATAAAAGLLALALAVPGFAPSSLAAPGPGPEADPQVAPGAEGVAAQDDSGGERARRERESELRAHRRADDDLEHDPDEHGSDEEWEHDFDRDFDFDETLDPAEIQLMVAEAMEAARAGLLDAEAIGEIEEEMGDAVAEVMEQMPELLAAQQEALDEIEREMPRILAEAEREAQAEGRRLTPEEREEMQHEIERELAEAREELRRALDDAGPQMEELRRVQRRVSVDVREEMRQAHEELARAERAIRQELREEARVEVREAQAVREEVLREVRREVEQAEREAERASRELEEMRRQLDREREALESERRALEEERRELERRKRERAEEPPGS